MDFDIQIAHSVKEVGQSAWDETGSGRPFSSFRWYRFGETVMADCIPVYIILSRHGEPVARATFWVIKNEPLPIAWKPARYVMQTWFHRWPLFICRSPLAGVSGLILPDPPLRQDALQVIAKTAMLEAKKNKAAFIFFDFMEEESDLQSVCPKQFATYIFSDPGTRMEISWSSFDEYLANLSQKSRKHYRQHLREADKLGIRITSHNSVTNIETALGLIKDVENRHSSTPNPWMRNMLENINMIEAAWLTADIDHRMVGCELILEDNGTQMVTCLGLNHDIPHTYFLMGYADIKYAIENGRRTLRWGSGVYETKRRLGFMLEQNNNVVYRGCGLIPSLISRVAVS